ncbi:hypothetical protein SLS61_000085 [Didymella pomorum]
MALSIDQKRLKATKFPPEFDRKVDIEKVNIDLMKKWIAQKITDILGDEDDIVVETCYNLIEQNQFPKIKEIQIQLTGFLNKDTPAFCKELWDLMLSAQDSPMGVPKEMLEAKKLELQQEQLSKAAAESRRKEQSDQDDIVNMFRDTERPDRGDRGDRGRGRGRGGFRGERGDRGGYRGDRGGRGGRDFDRRPPRRDSRSPPPSSLALWQPDSFSTAPTRPPLPFCRPFAHTTKTPETLTLKQSLEVSTTSVEALAFSTT